MKRLALLLLTALLLCTTALAQDNPSVLTITFSAGAVDGPSVFTATLEDNDTTQALRQLFPLTLTLSDLGGYEKFANLDDELPECPENVEQVEKGDILLFGNKCVVIFYADAETPYNYTRIGRIHNPDALLEAMGAYDVVIQFTLDIPAP